MTTAPHGTTHGKKLNGRDRVIFALLLVAFFALLGFIAMKKPHGLALAAGVTALAWAASLAFNRELKPKAQLVGLLIPCVLAVVYGIAQTGADGGKAAPLLVWICGAMLAGAALLVPALGQRIYDVWMAAAVPIGWSASLLILAVVYYLVLTPIGLIMRLIGRDSMQRRFESACTSYWIEHKPARDPQRYFRQF